MTEKVSRLAGRSHCLLLLLLLLVVAHLTPRIRGVQLLLEIVELLCIVGIVCRRAHERRGLETAWAASARWALIGSAKRIARPG